jgi:hypothetical protein
MSYYVIKCNYCGNYNTVSGHKGLGLITLKCRRCNKSQKIKTINTWGLNNEVSPKFEDITQARNYIKEKTEKETGFFSYKRNL